MHPESSEYLVPNFQYILLDKILLQYQDYMALIHVCLKVSQPSNIRYVLIGIFSTKGSSTSSSVACVPSIWEDSKASLRTYMDTNKFIFGI